MKIKIEELKRRVARATTEEERKKFQRQVEEEIRFMKQGGMDKFVSPFGNIAKGFKQAVDPIRYAFGMFGFKHVMPSPERYIKKEALATAEHKCYLLYDIYKKAHGMVTW